MTNQEKATYVCAVCEASVPVETDAHGQPQPESHYWKGTEMSEAYCGPECAMIGHKDYYKKIEDKEHE